MQVGSKTIQRTYEAGPHAKFRADQAQPLGELLESLGESYTLEDAVNAIRDDDHELHDLVEWNDGVAAERWRCQQMHHHIRTLKVVVISEAGDTGETVTRDRAFHSVVVDREGDDAPRRAFVSLNRIAEEPELLGQWIGDAWRGLLAWRRMWESRQGFMYSFKPVCDAIEALEGEMGAA